MLEIKSVNAACYVASDVGVEPMIGYDDDGLNQFVFERTPQVMDSYIRYRETIHEGELKVNLVDFINNFDKCKGMTKNSAD